MSVSCKGVTAVVYRISWVWVMIRQSYGHRGRDSSVAFLFQTCEKLAVIEITLCGILANLEKSLLNLMAKTSNSCQFLFSQTSSVELLMEKNPREKPKRFRKVKMSKKNACEIFHNLPISRRLPAPLN